MNKSLNSYMLFVGVALFVGLLMLSCEQGTQQPTLDKNAIQAAVEEILSKEKVGARSDLVKQSSIERILKSGQLRVGFEAGFVPFEMTDKKGNFIGFDMDYATRLAMEMGVKFVPVNTPWHLIIEGLTTDKYDIIMGGMSITQERNLKINFANPYTVVGQTILLNKKHEGKVKSYKDLNDPKYVLTSRLGTTGEETIKKYMPKATYKSFQGENEAGLEVINGKADALVYDLPLCAYLHGSQGKGKTVFLNQPITYEPLAWAINKGDPDFLNYLNNFLQQTKGDGFYDRLYKKWIVGTDWKKELE
jgi:polar amino acid transport system substrate-binding protein